MNFSNARALMNQWGIGRSGFDDGLVLMVGLEENLINGKVALYGGSGFLAAYADEEALQEIVERRVRPARRSTATSRAPRSPRSPRSTAG